MRTELELINDAQNGSDEVSKEAIKELKERFDITYHFCADCDFAVTTESNCCLNREVNNENIKF